MTEPRLEESASAFERELLQAGSEYRVSAESREKTLAALGLGATFGAAGATTAAAQSSALGKLAWAKGLLELGWVKGTIAAVVAVGAIASAPALYHSLTAEEHAPAAPPGAPAHGVAPRAADGAAAQHAPIPAESAPSSEQGSAMEQAPATERLPAEEIGKAKGARPAAPPVSAKAEPPEVTTESLRAELAALDAARAKLSSGSAKGALAALDEYARSYPRGLLRLEAEVLRIDALAQAGQTQAAKERANAFLRQHPKGVLAARVRRYAEP